MDFFSKSYKELKQIKNCGKKRARNPQLTCKADLENFWLPWREGLDKFSLYAKNVNLHFRVKKTLPEKQLPRHQAIRENIFYASDYQLRKTTHKFF